MSMCASLDEVMSCYQNAPARSKVDPLQGQLSPAARALGPLGPSALPGRQPYPAAPKALDLIGSDEHQCKDRRAAGR